MAKSQVKKEKTPAPKSIDDLRKNIEKEFGNGSIMFGRGSIINVEVFSTGVPSIDVALGCLGLPQGRIIEIYGAESSGKTTTCLQFIAACQSHYFEDKERQGMAAFIDAEHAFDPKWAQKVGVNMDTLLMSQPDSGEEAINILERLIDSELIDLVVVDSVAALTPKAVLDGEVGDSTMAALAQLMSKTMNRIKSKCNKTKTTVIFVNQIREKVGLVFGNPEITPGGRALKFYSSIRIEVKKGSPIKADDNVIGFRPTVKIVKNKVAPPFLTGEYDICVGHKIRPVFGIDTASSLLEVAAEHNIVKKNGSFFVYGDNKLGNGAANAAMSLRANKELYESIKKQTYDRIRTETNSSFVQTEEDDEDAGFEAEEE